MRLLLAFTVLISVLIYFNSLKGKAATVENFMNPTRIEEILMREYGKKSEDGPQIIINNRRNDGIKLNSLVDAQCRLARVWYLQEKAVGSKIYDLNTDHSCLVSIGRNRDLSCYDVNDSKLIQNDLTQRTVAAEDIRKFSTEKELYKRYEIPIDKLHQDGLDRIYFAYFIGDDDSETMTKPFDINEEFDNPISKVTFMMKTERMEQLINKGFNQILGSGHSLFCKVAPVGKVNDKKQIQLSDSVYERCFAKSEDGSFDIVYRNSKTANIVNLSDVESVDDFMKKYCITDCSKAIERPDVWYKKGDTFERTNFVDAITSPIQNVCERVNYLENNVNIRSSDTRIIQEKNIDLDRYKYDEENDRYKSKLQYNSDDYYYVKGDPKYEIPITKCVVGESYETKQPVRQYVDANRWINVEDRKCDDVNKCEQIISKKIQYMFQQKISVLRSDEAIVIQPTNNPTIDGKIKSSCESIIVKCEMNGKDNFSLYNVSQSPVLWIRKQNKENVFMMKISDKHWMYDTKNPGANEILFQRFDVYPNDKFEFLLQSSSENVDVSNLEIVFNCKQYEYISDHATYIQDNTCSFSNVGYCDYDTQFYTKDGICEDYNIYDDCKVTTKYSDSNAFCQRDTREYDGTKMNDVDLMFNKDIYLMDTIDNCFKRCDSKVGCVGALLDSKMNNCRFFGFESSIVRITTEVSEDNYIDGFKGRPAKIKVVHGNNQEVSYESNENEIVKKFDEPVHINRVEISTEKTVTSLVIYSYKNDVQINLSKEQLDTFKQTNMMYIIDNVYSEAT